MRWTYHIEWSTENHGLPNEDLNRLGEAVWELVSVCPVNSIRVAYYFKRPVHAGDHQEVVDG